MISVSRLQPDVEHPPDVFYHRPQQQQQQEQRGYGRAYSQPQPAEEYVELHQKRESDI